MRVACPSCQAEISLEVLLAREAEVRAVAGLLEHSLPFGALVLRYVALFRPAKRRLGLERMAALIHELLPDLQRQAITRKGREWAAPLEVWTSAIEAVLGARDKGSITLPLTSHAYLYEVISAQADKAEAAAERQREDERRGHREPRDPQAAGLAQLATVLTTAPPPPPPYVRGTGPSKAAQRLKAEMEARMALRSGAAGDPSPTEGA